MSNAVATTSIIKTLDSIVDKNITKELPMTTNKVLLYTSGSALTHVSLGKLSN